mgnify:FL=1
MAKYQRIRDLREDRDYSQEYVGKVLNLSQRAYAYYESGERLIPPEILSALADLYDVSVDYLLGRTDSKQTNR